MRLTYRRSIHSLVIVFVVVIIDNVLADVGTRSVASSYINNFGRTS